MERRNRAKIAVALLATLVLAGCSDRSLVAPDESDGLRLGVQSTPGTYAISFLIEAPGGLVPVENQAPVGSYLVLQGEVTDNLGNTPTSGSVTYEYCWAKGNYAPSAMCVSGAGSWKRLMSIRVMMRTNADGTVEPDIAPVGFGWCSTPRSIGFRITFSGRGSGVASGVSAPRDFTWY